jgi:hypothetical protein
MFAPRPWLFLYIWSSSMTFASIVSLFCYTERTEIKNFPPCALCCRDVLCVTEKLHP